MRGRRLLAPLLLAALALPRGLPAADADAGAPEPLALTLWAREPMLTNPVALHFDDRGRLYVAETARRLAADLDIREHRRWIHRDLALETVEQRGALLRHLLRPEKSRAHRRWLADRNGDGRHDWRDLATLSERIRLLEDTDGDGRADRSEIFAEGFDRETTGTAAGVLWHEGSVYAAIVPDLWRLRDADADGRADLREPLLSGFGVHIGLAGHDLHGLRIGPDGKLYFTMGDKGLAVGDEEKGRVRVLDRGVVLRCALDGSGLEVFASGLRNPQEIAFDRYGNLFTVDNDGDFEGERERLVYLVEGGDSGWRRSFQFRGGGWPPLDREPAYNPWMAEELWRSAFAGQAAHVTPPLANYAVGPSGFAHHPGVALNDRYRDHFFLVQFPVQKITTFRLRPRGASFEMEGERVLHEGLMASSLAFGPDGALYVADWDGFWEPNQRGAIQRLDDPAAARSPERAQVRRLLAEGMGVRPLRELRALLAHADGRVRGRAQFELVKRGEAALLLGVARERGAERIARIHALWGLGQLGAAAVPGVEEQLPLADPDPELRAQAARLAGELGVRRASRGLVPLLEDPSPRVRLHAAIALGKLGANSAVPALLALLERNADRDPFLRHAGVMGLVGAAEEKALAALAAHPAQAVRIGAVLALRRLRSPQLARFLADPDERVLRETARGVHDDLSVPAALDALGRLLERDGITDEPTLRRAVSANLRVGSEPAASRLIAYAADAAHPEALRVEALEALGAWSRRPFLDRVEGRVRDPGERDAEIPRALVAANLARVLRSAGPALTGSATRVARELAVEVDGEVVLAWVASPHQEPALRARALRLLAERDAPELPAALRAALATREPSLRAEALRIQARRDPDGALRSLAAPLDALPTPEAQSALAVLASLGRSEADERIARAFDRMLAGELPAALHLDVLEAARARGAPLLRRRLERYEAALPADDPIARHRPALHGGDPERGERIFSRHAGAQCVRCHSGAERGNQAGPDLAGIGSRVDRDYLLAALVDPGAAIAPGFERSYMPPMGSILRPRELRDLVAYLASLR